MSIRDAVLEATAGMFSDSFTRLGNIGTTVGNILSNGSAEGSVTVISDVLSKVNDVVTGTIIPTCQGIGYAIALLFFVISLIEFANQDRLTIESFIKHFSKIIIAIFLISIAKELYTQILEFGNALTSVLSSIGLADTSSTTAYTKENLTKALIEYAENNKSSWMVVLLEGALVGLVSQITVLAITVVVYVIAFSRIIELTVRGAFLPIALGLISDDGWRGTAGRYVKKFIAICCQSAVLTLIAQISSYIIKTCCSKFLTFSGSGAISAAELSGSLVVLIGVVIAMISVMFKSIGIINDVFGG